MGFTSFPTVPVRPARPDETGLGTFSPPCVYWERTGVDDPQFRHVPFGSSSPANRETSVSWSLITTVQANVHMTFPIPFTPASPHLSCSGGWTALACSLCALRHGMFNRSSARADYSSRTSGRGHAVPRVVLVRRTRHRRWCRGLVPPWEGHGVASSFVKTW